MGREDEEIEARRIPIMMNDCPLCNLALISSQNIILENEHCLFLQLEEKHQKGIPLEGSDIIIPKIHRETTFDITAEEWQATYELLHEAKLYLDTQFQPQGYNLGWNCGEIAGQHIPHAHFHILPRYKDEQLAGKGIRFMFKDGKNMRN